MLNMIVARLDYNLWKNKILLIIQTYSAKIVGREGYSPERKLKLLIKVY